MSTPREARRADVVVVGGGVTGCSAAWFLAREGLDVLVVERDEVAAHASGAAAGMLAPIAEAVPGSALLQTGRAALDELRGSLCAELQGRSGIDPELEPSGLLRVALDDAQERAQRARCEALRADGVAIEWLDARTAAALQPGLAPELRGASWSRSEAHVRSPLLTRAYAGAARSLGARIVPATSVGSLVWEGDAVTGVRVNGALSGTISAGCVVVCAGCWSGVLEDWLGARGERAQLPPVEPIRGQILSLREPTPVLRTIVWGDAAYLVPKRDGSLVVGATEERVGFDARVTASGMAQLAAAAPTLVPSLGDASFERGWAGLRPSSPDGLPAIGRVAGAERLVMAYGHHRNGVLLSPLSGRRVRDLVVGKEADALSRAFDPTRFAREGDARANEREPRWRS
jgi:glycine oxidase